VLLGTATLEDAIQPTEVERLDVLASGQRTSNPSELLNSQTFLDTLERLKNKYDYVLVDSPPVGIVTDAQILANLCGLTLLVLRANKSSRLLTQRAGGALLTVSARVAGVIVNGVSKKDTQYSHHSVLSSYQSSYSAASGPTTRNELPPGAGRHRRNEVLTSPEG
jgi:polysaccharide biosynthesis transport protein